MNERQGKCLSGRLPCLLFVELTSVPTALMTTPTRCVMAATICREAATTWRNRA